MHREQKYTYMQHTEEEREQDTENSTHISPSQPQHTCSAHNFSTYSFDLYNEYAYIKNSNTIELYTISKD